MKTIKLSRQLVTVVDDDDYDFLMQWKWSADHKGYAIRSEKRTETGRTFRKQLYMHRVIMGANPLILVDHINGDVLDNRKENLRFATHPENMRNRRIQRNNKTGYKGVGYNPKKNRYYSYLKVNGKSRIVFLTRDKAEAAHIYNQFAEQIYGDFARLNEIPVSL
jgi:hypothetical protein